MSFDGVFSMAAKRRDLYLFKRSEKFYDLALSEIHAVTPTKIQTLASNFLRPEAFYVSIAGSTQ
jgi:predicted Zn-dependent peptidase